MDVFLEVIMNKVIREIGEYNTEFMEEYSVHVNWKFTDMEYTVRIGLLLGMNLQFSNLD